MSSFISQIDVEQVMGNLPPLGILAMGIAVVAGVVIWLLGAKLLRFGVISSGLVLGGLAGLALGNSLADQGAYVLPMIIGGVVSGGLLAWLLFRVWMGLTGAAVIALVVPAAMIVWQGIPTPEGVSPRELKDRYELQKQGEIDLGIDLGAPEEPEEEPKSGVMKFFDDIYQVIRQLYVSEAEDARAWWDELEPGTQNALMAAGGVGAVIGLVLGLILPQVSAKFQTALVGALLIALPGRALLVQFVPDYVEWMYNARLMIIAVGLITVGGFVIQYTAFRQKTDK